MMLSESAVRKSELKSSLLGGDAGVDDAALQAAIAAASQALRDLQNEDGHWCFPLETDCTISAEYILMMHYMDEIDDVLQEKLARYIRSMQQVSYDGGWPLYDEGECDLSCTVKCYFALKAAGDSEDAEHMRAAREAILQRGGAARSNIFTHVLLALFGEMPWEGVPYVPVEIMLFPKWFPFNLEKISYWARATMVPLFILCAHKARGVNPRGITVRELYTVPPEQETQWFESKGPMDQLFLALDQVGRRVDRFIPAMVRNKALKKAEAWFVERLNGEDGIGAIFPPMVHALQAMALLGYDEDHPARATCVRALQKLIAHRDDGSAMCQACVSPVWDTVWSSMALLRAEPGSEACAKSVDEAMKWLAPRQILDVRGDWTAQAPDLLPGGWAFQYNNPHFPDLDDTAVVASLLHLSVRNSPDADRYRDRINRAADWLAGMQSSNGGFAAFDRDNDREYINHIPFADHGAMLDPPTEDVSGRVIACLGLLDRPQDRKAIRRCIRYLKRRQQKDGSWWGRWGTNYIYGTWSVLAGLVLAGENPKQRYIQRAVSWLKEMQNADGGWGESNDTYAEPELSGLRPEVSTPQTTAWAMLALMSAGEASDDCVRRGAQWLMQAQEDKGLWSDPSFNAPGFPRVFYLKYYGYTAYFPLWALARFRQLNAA